MTRSGLSGWVGLIVVALVLAAEAWAARSATVRGAERAFIRRGPGTEFQAYGTVENGEQVTVDEVTGTWALVHAAGGQSGYVHAAFLFYSDNQPVLVSTPTVGAASAPTPAPAAVVAAAVVPPTAARPAAQAGAETTDLAQRNAELAAELEASRRELEAVRRNPSAAPSPGEDLVALRAEVRRLADITDALRSRLDSPSAGGAALALVGEEPWGTSTVVVLAGCALLLGWVIGGILARREERGRRNRIRF